MTDRCETTEKDDADDRFAKGEKYDEEERWDGSG
jgi:hypothetical protein